MKIDDLVARVQRGDDSSGLLELKAPLHEIAVIVQRTLFALDLHVDNDGEIYSPAPAPSLVIPTVPAMNNLRFGGRKRRR